MFAARLSFPVLCSVFSVRALPVCVQADVTSRPQVEGDLDQGVVNLHLVKRPGQKEYEYKYLYLDVAGTCKARYVHMTGYIHISHTASTHRDGFCVRRWRGEENYRSTLPHHLL